MAMIFQFLEQPGAPGLSLENLELEVHRSGIVGLRLGTEKQA